MQENYTFKVGDVVVHKYPRPSSIFKCVSGEPIKIMKIDKAGHLSFHNQDGGDDWPPEDFELFQENTTESIDNKGVVRSQVDEGMTVNSCIKYLLSQGYSVTISKGE